VTVTEYVVASEFITIWLKVFDCPGSIVTWEKALVQTHNRAKRIKVILEFGSVKSFL
jgi:hypothetical protein